ncbi:MAG: hypothetical protein JO225_09810, partial [Candidatus Eremiobacteraeota bacterium]|nr:hypothetical protein [Candidatus Eremiobacteraeota bacterium]
MNRRSTTSLALLAALALAGCGGGGGAHALPQTPFAAPTPTPSGGTAGTASFAYGADALAGAQYLGPANVGTLGVDVVLQAQNADGLVRYAAAVS